MVVSLITDDGDRLIDFDELKLFGLFRECDPETARTKWKEDNNVSVRNEATGLFDRVSADGRID